MSDEAFDKALNALAQRRSLLLGLVEHTGWDWDAVSHLDIGEEEL